MELGLLAIFFGFALAITMVALTSVRGGSNEDRMREDNHDNHINKNKTF